VDPQAERQTLDKPIGAFGEDLILFRDSFLRKIGNATSAVLDLSG